MENLHWDFVDDEDGMYQADDSTTTSSLSDGTSCTKEKEQCVAFTFTDEYLASQLDPNPRPNPPLLVVGFGVYACLWIKANLGTASSKIVATMHTKTTRKKVTQSYSSDSVADEEEEKCEIWSLGSGGVMACVCQANIHPTQAYGWASTVNF